MMVCSGLMVVLGVTSLSVITRAQDGSGGGDVNSLELANNDYSDYPDEEWDDPDRSDVNVTETENISAGEDWTMNYDDYPDEERDNPDRGDISVTETENISAGEDYWTMNYDIPEHNDFLDPVFCKENCHGDRNPGDIRNCEKACPRTPWVSLKDVSLELNCSTEAAVLTYDLSKLLEKKFKDLKIQLSQEKKDEESLTAGEDSVLSYEDSTEYPVINTDQDDRQNETHTKISERIEVDVESLGSHTFSGSGLCSDQSYTYCLHVTHGQMTEVDTKSFCQSCTPRGAPHFQPEEVRIDGGGVTFIDVSWDDPKGAECEGTYYQVVLNGSPHIRKLKKTEQRVEKISPGEYQVSVKAINEHGESDPWPPEDATPDPKLLYTIKELQPPSPEDIRIEVSVEEDGGVVADIVWSDDETELEDGGWLVYVTSPLVTEMDKLVPRVNTSEYRVELRDSHPLSAISIVRYELEMTSNKSEPMPLFSQLHLGPPKNVVVTNEVKNGVLIANVTWDNGDVSIREETLGMNADIFTDIKVTEMQENQDVPAQQSLDDNWFLIRLSDASWTSELILSTATSNYKGVGSDPVSLFTGVTLSPPDNIRISYAFEDGELIAVLEWDNTMEKEFEGLETVVNFYEGPRVKRDVEEEHSKTEHLPYSQTLKRIRFSEHSWDSEVSLQTSVQGSVGDAGERLRLFSDGLNLGPPTEVTTLTSVNQDGDLEAELAWNNPNRFSDNSSLPLLLKIYSRESADGEKGSLIKEIKIGSGVESIGVPLDGMKPWEVSFTLETDYPGVPSVASNVSGLLEGSEFNLDPPHIITGVACSENSTCSFEWCQENFFNGLATLVTIWHNKTHVASKSRVEDLGNCTTHEINITGLGEDAEISLETDLDRLYFSEPSDRVPIFPRTSSILFGRDNTLWIVLGLSLLLILYIIATVLCLRSVRKKRGVYKVDKTADNVNGHNGTFYEYQDIPRAESQHLARSDNGSRDTEQESLMSDGSARNLIPRADSVVTLGKFHDDDDFMGNFDEDGSFIGDYTQYNEEASQAMQNKLLYFSQFYNKVNT